MSKEKKAQIIEQVEEGFKKSSIGIVTDYRGLRSAELSGLRRKLKESGMQIRVVKNTLSRQAAERLGRKEIEALFTGPVAIVSGQGDEARVAKVLDDYIRSTRSTLTIKGGFLGDKPLTAKDVATLATLPPREVLLARIMGGVQAPISGIMNILNSPMRGIAIALQGRIKQLEGK